MNCFRVLCLVLIFSLKFSLIIGQNSAPEGIYYQAVARDDQGNEMVSEALSLQISIREDAAVIYTENHTTTSDQFGLFDLVIGNGEAQTALSFEEITWEASQYFLIVALDSGDGFETLSETQLLSVPFSLYATTALNVINDDVTDADSNPTNELISSFIIENDTLRLTDAGNSFAVGLPIPEVGEDNDWTLAPDSVVHNSNQSNKVGINTSSPSSTLQVDGSVALDVIHLGQEFVPSVEIGIEQSVILCNTTLGAIQLELPDATECQGRIYMIKKYADNISDLAEFNVTLMPSLGQLIDLQPIRILSGPTFEEITIISDGANWFIISRSSFQP